MKTVAPFKLRYLFISVSVLIVFAVQKGFAQKHLNTPYPIIFVHGLNSDYTTWGTEDGQFDNIIDYLDGAGLQPGGNINIALKYKRSPTTLSVAKEQDVSLLNQPSFGDYYTINFNVHANGFIPVTHTSGPLVIQPVVLDLLGISNTATQFEVSLPDEFTPGDIIRVRSEFMQVTAVNGSTLTVVRGVYNSTPVYHIPNPLDNLVVWNLSGEGNQASIAKQGYALKLAIDAIKLKTGSNKVILVGHSMGGLAAREYIKNYSNNDVAKIVTIGTPHYGSNVSDFPNGVLALKAIDGRSDAVRDLRTTINDNLGIYLFGGDENSISGFDSQDANGNGILGEFIDGLNGTRGYASLQNIAHTWIASVWHNIIDVGPTLALGKNDGIVLTKSQYISSDDTLTTTGFHTDEPKDYYTLLRGLDEPGDPSLAYEISRDSLSSTTKGFITFGLGNNPIDIDLYKIVIKDHATLAVNILASTYSRINTISLLNEDQSVRTPTSHTSQSITDDVDPGTYFIKIAGTANHGVKPLYQYASYKYPYTLTTTTTVIPPAKFTTSPTASLSYYDVITNLSKDKIVTITNSGSTDVAVSSLLLTGSNANQFSITGSTSFIVAAGAKKEITVRFNPTSVGAKVAALRITSNSADSPVKNIKLNGSGVDHPTKTLTVTNDVSYNYGDLTIANNKSKTFTLQNTGSDPLTISGLSITGQNAAEFTINNLPVLPFDLQSGDSKQVTLTFSPATIGAKTANFNIANNSDNGAPTHQVILFGNGTNSIYTGITGSLVAYEYWFDDNYAAKVRTAVNSTDLAYLSTNFPTTGLTGGSHFLHIRYQDKKGQWSTVVSRDFYKTPPAPSANRKIVTYEYWFDSNYAAKVTTPIAPIQAEVLNTNIDAKLLATGTHTYNIRFKDDIGEWSAVTSTVFNKTPLAPAGDRKIVAYEYWFDNNYPAKVTTSVTPVQTSIINTDIDAKLLITGTHVYNVRFKDDIGEWSAVTSTIFSKTPLAATGDRKIVAYEYWFDNSYSTKVITAITPTQTGVINADIDAKLLASGTHIYNVRFKDDIGNWSTVTSTAFSRAPLTPSGPAKIVEYEYWFDNNYTSKVSVPVAAALTTTVNGNINTNALPAGAHNYNIRFQDNLGQWSSVSTSAFIALSKNANLSKLVPGAGTLSPVFASATTAYTVSVANTVTSIKLTPTVSDTTARVKINGVAVPSGTASAPIALNVGANVITTVVTAQDGVTTKSYVVTITRVASSNAVLTNIKLTPNSILTTVAGPDYRDYTTSVPNTVTSVTVTPTAQDSTATIKVNGITVASGTASKSISLNVGSNVITTVVTAQDGVTTKSYVINITRLSSNAILTSILLTPKTILTATTGPGYRNYTASVSNSTASVTVTPTAQDATATIKVNGIAAPSGAASKPITLNVGNNVITTIVTAQDGVTTKSYVINITRVSTNAVLSAIQLTPKTTLTTTTGPGYRNYTASVANGVASVTVTPTTQDVTATIKVAGVAVVSGTASQPIALNVGSNVITTIVTAQDGATTKSYIITVTRAASAFESAFEPVVEQPIDGITVHHNVSPNGDGISDYLAIDGLEAYPGNKLMIMKRSGELVFEAKGYGRGSKLFDGHSSVNGKMQLQGTYFYSLTYKAGNEVRHKTGFIVLKY